MITWIIVTAGLAVLFAILGFSGLAKGFAAIAKVLFYILLVVFIVILVMNLLG